MTVSAPIHLTPLYDRWLIECLGEEIPSEPRATCSSCAMCGDSTTAREASGSERFSPDTKCCTYWPTLANFLLGGVLGGGDSAIGATRVEQLMTTHPDSFTPFGGEATEEYRILYAAVGDAQFGRSSRLLCPYYDRDAGGACTVWRHRNRVCSTWFCKHVRGDVSARFWESVKALLQCAERNLAFWCVAELGCSDDCLRMILERTSPLSRSRGANRRSGVDGAPRPDVDRLWGRWRDRKVEFYREAARLVQGLSWSDVLAYCGLEGRILVDTVRKAREALASDEVPERLSTGPFKVQWISTQGVAVSTYRGSDPLRLSKRLFDLLQYFDGRPLAEVLARLKAMGTDVDAKLVRTLVDFKILIPSDSPAPSQIQAVGVRATADQISGEI